MYFLHFFGTRHFTLSLKLWPTKCFLWNLILGLKLRNMPSLWHHFWLTYYSYKIFIWPECLELMLREVWKVWWPHQLGTVWELLREVYRGGGWFGLPPPMGCGLSRYIVFRPMILSNSYICIGTTVQQPNSMLFNFTLENTHRHIWINGESSKFRGFAYNTTGA